MYFVGIDPGLTGAVGILNEQGNYLTCSDLPTIPKPSKKAVVKRELDPFALYQLLNQQLKTIWNKKGIVLIEKVASRSQQGVASTFSLGDSFGVLRAVFSLSPFAVEFVVPAVWKRAVDLLGRDKEAAREKAQALYPKAPLHRKKDHNRAEALLLARYGWAKYGLK